MENFNKNSRLLFIRGILKDAYNSLGHQEEQDIDIQEIALNAAQRYEEELVEKCEPVIMFLSGIEKLVSLNDIYVNVNIDEYFSPTYRSIDKEVSPSSAIGENSFLKNLLIGYEKYPDGEEVSRKNFVVILGEPGIGKTTFFKYLALHSLDRELDIPMKARRIPVFISLKDLGKKKRELDLLKPIHNQFKDCGLKRSKQLVKILSREGKFVLFLDGFDEIPQKNRAGLIKSLRKLAKINKENKLVLSCRYEAYNKRNFSSFDVWELSGFDETSVRTFIRNWFKATNKPEKIPGCAKAIMENNLKGLARNPYSLALLCIAYDIGKDLTANRAKLIKNVVGHFLSKKDKYYGINQRSTNEPKNLLLEKERVFSETAWKMSEEGAKATPIMKVLDIISRSGLTGPAGLMPHESHEEWILKKLIEDHGIWQISHDDGKVSFLHSPVQEFFTANYFVEFLGPEKRDKLLIKRILNEDWKEVIVLVSGLLDHPKSFQRQIKNIIQNKIKRDEQLDKVVSQVNKIYAESSRKQTTSKWQIFGVLLRTAQNKSDQLSRGKKFERSWREERDKRRLDKTSLRSQEKVRGQSEVTTLKDIGEAIKSLKLGFNYSRETGSILESKLDAVANDIVQLLPDIIEPLGDILYAIKLYHECIRNTEEYSEEKIYALLENIFSY